jgi:GTP-binding protein EngB required for normal cell division
MHRNATAIEPEIPCGALSPRRPSSAPGLGPLFDRISLCLAELGPEFAREECRLAELGKRLDEGRFHLAVLGQFKRGKSTLLNALLGHSLLPTSVVPLTAIPTFLRAGRQWQAKVAYTDGHSGEQVTSDRACEITAFLEKYVTEAANPNNQMGINHVEVSSPSEILARGVVLIDTPGIGSTFRHNTEATLNFLPQCDAALFLVSADPPITEVEVEFLKKVRSKVVRLFFLFNKIDYLTEEEREAAVPFLRGVLRDQVGMVEEVPIFCVSARAGLEARQANDTGLWMQSGMADVERHLIDFLASEKAVTLGRAIATRVQGIVSDVLMRVRLLVRSLQMPLGELQKRMNRFEESIADAQRQRVVAADLLAGDKRRAIARMEEMAEELRKRSRIYLQSVIQDTLATAADGTEEATAQQSLHRVIPPFFEHELGVVAGSFDQYMRDVLHPHRTRADKLIQHVRETAATLFDIPSHPEEVHDSFEPAEQPYWTTDSWKSHLAPVSPEVLDRLLPAAFRQARIRSRLKQRVEKLVIRNVEDLRWSTLQGLEEAFRQFGSGLDGRLKEAITATHGAMQAARTRRQEHADTVAVEIARLETCAAELCEIQSSIARLEQ